MAIYSLSTSSIKRSDGRSAVAAAAYRAGSEIVDERTGVEHDYTRKRGVEHVEIFTRDGVPSPYINDLWNDAERAEKRKDGRTAREVLIALPAELNADQRLALARDMTADLAERYGVAAQLAVHAPDHDGDQRNHHAHILITTRTYGHDGLGKKAQLEWSGTQCRKNGVAKPADELKMLRERWASMQNSALERAQVPERVDHRSLDAQGIDRAPQIHVGNHGTQMIRAGTPEESERASLNLEIIGANAELTHLREQHDVEHRAKMRAAAAENQRLAAIVENYEYLFSPQPSQPEPEPFVPPTPTQPEPEPEPFVPPTPTQQPQPEPEPKPFVPPTPTQQPQPQPEPKPFVPPTPVQRAPEPEPEPFVPPTPTQRQPESEEPEEPKSAAAYAEKILRMDSQGERATAIREADRGDNLDFVDELDEQLAQLGVEAHGELSPAGESRRAELLASQQTEAEPEKPLQQPNWPPMPRNDGPGF